MPTTATIKIGDLQFEGPYNNTNQLKNFQGIYAILDDGGNQDWSLLDVGESTDVKTRIEGHDRKDCWSKNAKGAIWVAVYYTPGWTDEHRRAVESRIRKQYAPPCGER